MDQRVYASRIKALQELQKAQGLNCVALVPGANLRYFTGLARHLSERPMVAFLPVAGQPALALPVLEVPGARALLPDDVQLLAYSDEEGHEHVFGQVAGALGLDREGVTLGVEYLAMRLLEARRIEQAMPGCRMLATEPWLPTLRMRKDEAEVALMRRAIEIAEAAMERLLQEGAIREGRTELEVASDLRVAMLREGGEEEAFEPIVVAGPNSASPHAGPSDRPLARGDLVTVDWGTSCQGYRSDITRTYVLGEPSPEIERIYDAVLAANQAGRLTARAGMAAQEVDRAARRAITLAGYGPHFLHRTGHGLGLETHEPPYMVEGELEILQPGMTFTVEPGIYVPGLGGVRIEDDVLITEDGRETLTSMPRELRRL
ncbi:MAG TPA: Xaa-Pro peptidase family protein [Anaerolineae bacterium]|nr:Xaa-Pro peptidase family protein [Anaerolineae bacterium]